MGQPVKWQLRITPAVQETVRSLPPKIKRYIQQAFEEIRKDPWSGKSLRDELEGYYSFRVRRFRVIYRLKRQLITVLVVGVDPRSIIYKELASSLPE